MLLSHLGFSLFNIKTCLLSEKVPPHIQIHRNGMFLIVGKTFERNEAQWFGKVKKIQV